jgi:GT2 family glycosyltransferase
MAVKDKDKVKENTVGDGERKTAGSMPAMSVVLITPDTYAAIRKTISHLRAQTMSRQLELVMVAPSAARLDPDKSELHEFCGFRIVELGPIRSTGRALAEGIRHATAPIVAYAEEHSYPEPGWAESLIEAHGGSWAGVGAVLCNANPSTKTSWAHLYTDFGPWVAPAEVTETFHLSAHHTAYKREVLLSFGPLLDELLEVDYVLNRELQAKGYKLYLQPAARSCHVNCSRPGSLFWAEFHGGRLFGSARAAYEHWSILRRLLYVAGMPLIPLLRLWRVQAEINRTGRKPGLFPGILLPLLTSLAGHSLGEAIGYAMGAGDAAERRTSIELSRHRHVINQEKSNGGLGDACGRQPVVESFL